MLQSIVIVGGGTAGWLAANHLGKKFLHSSVKVTLIESPNIPTIGVGEGTVPMMRQTLAYLGIDEGKFFQQCDVAFKQGIRFENWMQSDIDKAHFYYHPFDYFSEDDRFVKSWLASKRDIPFAEFVGLQAALCEQNKGPKKVTQPQFDSHAGYAYHLDAGKFSELLKEHATNAFGVNLIYADMESISSGPFGEIAHIVTDKGIIEADLFVDCTGFRSLILGEKLGVRLIDKNHILFADKALAVQVPHNSTVLTPYTRSTAQTAGWIWDISLFSRKGIGHVYSSNHTTQEAAYKALETYLGINLDSLSVRSIDMKIGYREKAWFKNCVGLGLSQGFVEPLEATGLLVFDVTAKMLADILPSNKDGFIVASEQFNGIVSNMWNKVIDFIKLHYCISDRNDSTFWLDNRLESSIPDSLLEKLERWKVTAPNQYDFGGKFDVFNLDNYLYVLYGMSFTTASANNCLGKQAQEDFLQYIQNFEGYKHKLISSLPEHRQLLEQIRKYGLSKV